MYIQVTHKLHFKHEGQNFITPEINALHQAPDWIVNDPYFGENHADGRIKVFQGAEIQPPAPTVVPPTEPQEPEDKKVKKA